MEKMEKLAVRATNFFPDGTTADNFISADDNVLSTEPLLMDAQIIDSIMDKEKVSAAMNDASEEPIYTKATDVRNALEVLPEYMLFSEKGGEIKGNLYRISLIVMEDEVSVILKQREMRIVCQ